VGAVTARDSIDGLVDVGDPHARRADPRDPAPGFALTRNHGRTSDSGRGVYGASRATKLTPEENDMEQSPKVGDRITDKSATPDESEVRDWIGRPGFEHWAKLRRWIDESYPGVFAPDWIYGGKNRGWSLRYTKAKALCSLVPAYRLLSVLVVLGGAEREKFEDRRYSWSPQLVKLYDETHTYHDGKWLTVPVSSAAHRHELTELLSMKRPPLSGG
jgi:hypothetical protein